MAAMPNSIVTKRSGSSLHDDQEQEDEHEDDQLRRGPWTVEEDNLLIHYIACHGEGRWNLLAKYSGLKRTGKSCRLRWLNYLKPDVKRGNLTIEEQILIIQLQSKLGNRWSRIAKHLPGRTDNEIKNFWRTKVQKQTRQRIGNNAAFHNAIGCFSIPIREMKDLAQSPPQPQPPPPLLVPPPPLPTPPPPTTTTTIEDSLIIEGIQNFSNQYHQVLMNNNSSCRGNYCTLSPVSNSSISSSSPDSIINISSFPEVSGYPTSPDQAFAGKTTTSTASNVDNYSFLKAPAGCSYYVMNSSNIVYDTEAFINLSSPTSEPGGLLANSITGRPIVENNWVVDNDVIDYGLW